jgi:hypothetical protein
MIKQLKTKILGIVLFTVCSLSLFLTGCNLTQSDVAVRAKDITASARKPQTRNVIQAFWVRVSENESVEYDWEQKVTPHPYKNFVEYNGYLTWTIYGKKRKYFVSATSFIPSKIELRINKAGNLWLLQYPSGGYPEGNSNALTIIASLNRKTGEFINYYGMVVNDNLSEEEQENLPRPRDDNTGPEIVKPFPSWANVKSGLVLARTGDIMAYTIAR